MFTTSKYERLANCLQIEFMISALDMFLEFNHKNLYAKARIGSIVTRYAFTRYQLMKIFPCSAAANGNVHMVVHGVGCLMGLTRSQRAYVPEYIGLPAIAHNIAMIYFGNIMIGNFVKEIISKSYMEKSKNSELSAILEAASHKTGGLAAMRGNASQVYDHYEKQGFRFIRSEFDTLRKLVKNFKNAGAKSMGYWMSHSFLATLREYTE
uniref:Uncharacterized protein n=1 Tax=Glossina brevipalpis TaxID=37001 RepID=A0A1A9WBE7_9MUSC